MLARLFVLVGVLVVLALTTALVGPYFVDWTNYRAEFEREAGAVLGRKVTVQGAATAKLLPFPSVTFTDVTVGSGAGGEPAMTVETFSMDAELAPFLSGEFLIFDMRLVRPKVVVDIAPDGTFDWAARPSTPFDPRKVSLERVSVTEGQVILRHRASGREHLFSEINAEIAAASLAGPWRAEGTLRADGARTALSVVTGAADETGAMSLRLKAEPAVRPISLESDGTLRLVDGAPVYDGQFRVGRRPAERLRDGEGGTVEVPALGRDPGLRLSGRFKADNARLALDQVRLETGPLDNPYTADGSGFIDLGAEPRFSISAKGAQVQFDRAVAGVEAEPGKGGAVTLTQRIAALEEALADLPRPAIPGKVEIDLPAVVLGDTTLRDIQLSAEPVAEGWRLNSLTTTLPGRTTLEANGLLRTGGAFDFTGSMLVAIAQPSGFAAWIARDVDEAIRRLPAAGFNAKVELTPLHQSFTDLELVLGGATFRGAVERGDEGARPTLGIDLAGEALDLDGLTAFAAMFMSDAGASRFAGHDLDLQLKAGPFRAGGLTAETIDAALRLREGTIEIDRLSIGGLAGAALSATGTLTGFPTQTAGSVDATLIADDLAPALALAAERYPDQPLIRELAARAAAFGGLFTDTRLDLVAKATPGGAGTPKLDLSAQGQAGGSTVSLSLSGSGRADRFTEAQLSLSFRASNPDATSLLALYGVPVLPLGLTGAGETALTMQGTLAQGLKTAFSLKAGDSDAGFHGSVGVAGEGFSARGKARVDASDIEPWLLTAGLSLPGMGMGTRTSLAADADFAEGLLVLSGLDGTVAETAVSGDINASVADGVPHLTGALAVDQLDLDPAFAAVFGPESTQSDPGEWPSAPFPQTAQLPFTAELDLTTGALSAAGSPNVYDASFSLAIQPEGLRIANLSGTLFGGELAGLLEVKNTGGTGLLSAQARLSGADLGLVLPDSGVAGQGDFSTALSASGKSVGGLVSTLSGSGTATLREISLPGLNPQALPALLAKADAVGRDISTAATAAFAPEIAANGEFTAAGADLAFTLAGGVMRAPPVTLDNPAATLSAELRADLNTGRVSADGALTYRAGDEALAGSEPALRFTVEGPLGAVTTTFDSEPLAQFLTQRALEREQARVEAMQAALLEKQRLRREVRYYAALQDERERLAEERRRAAEAERVRLEAEQARADEAARQQAEDERRQAEEAARRAEAAARRAEARAARRATDAASEAEPPPAVQNEAPAVRREPPVGERETEDLARDPLPTLKLEDLILPMIGG